METVPHGKVVNEQNLEQPMAETIESFVEKLQKEGIETGKAEAEKIIADARAEAEKIIADAKAQAEAIVNDARAQAQRDLKRGRDELELACRDTILHLRETINRIIKAVLEQAVDEKLHDDEFLESIIRQVVTQYAKQDAEGTRSIEIKLNDETLQAILSRTTAEMAKANQARAGMNLKGGLKSAGFQYESGEGKVEVTADSITVVLMGMISPRLREVIAKATGKDKKGQEEQPPSGASTDNQ